MSQRVMAEGPSPPGIRRRSWRALAILAALGLLWGTWAWWRDQNHRDAILMIELEMANGRFNTASRHLKTLLAEKPGSDEAAVLLGRCEKECGRIEAAAEALAQVEPGSPFAHQAILARMRLAHDQGQFARAEEIVNEAAADPRNDGPHTRFLLVPIYSQLGRLDEAGRLIEDRWEHLMRTGESASETAIDLVRMHIQLDLKPNPVEQVRIYLDYASRMAPDDDRVWLGRANLAIRTGDVDEARRLLDDCLRSRPEDASVWDARLRLGMATDDVEDVREALSHLLTEGTTPAKVGRVDAWFAAHRGDASAERRSLESLIEADPADLDALERLARLSEESGDSDRATAMRRQQAEIRQSLERYEFLYDRTQPIRDAVEMSEIAERLGRNFEARVFLTLAIAEDPDRIDLRRKLERLRPRARSTAGDHAHPSR